MKPSQTLKVHRSELRALAARYGVSRLRVFGSVARAEDDENSDLDLLVDPSESTTLLTLAALQLEAEALLGVHVDVLTPKSLPQRLRTQVLAEAQPV